MEGQPSLRRDAQASHPNCIDVADFVVVATEEHERWHISRDPHHPTDHRNSPDSNVLVKPGHSAHSYEVFNCDVARNAGVVCNRDVVIQLDVVSQVNASNQIIIASHDS